MSFVVIIILVSLHIIWRDNIPCYYF